MKNKLILVEGAKGTGKSTLTNYIREHVPYTQLIRLNGVEDKTITGLKKIYNVHENALKFVYECRGCNTNFVFDRTFLSERVFCQLVDKPYTFESETENLHNYVEFLSKFYTVRWVLLKADKADFELRLERGKADDTLVKSSVELSLKQQELYEEELDLLDMSYKTFYTNCLSMEDMLASLK